MRYARGLTQTAAVRLSCKTKNRAPDWIGAPALVRVGGSSRLSLNGLSIVSNITSEPEVVKRSDRATGAASAGVVPLWRGLDFGLGREPRIGLVVGRLWLAVRRGCTRGGGGACTTQQRFDRGREVGMSMIGEGKRPFSSKG
jgi:hypothetical protein